MSPSLSPSPPPDNEQGDNHPSNDDDDNDAAAAMAAAMGFSAFGAQSHPSKKRRFNPSTDAVVSRPPRRPAAPAGTSANATPLGHTRTSATQPPPLPHISNLPLHPLDGPEYEDGEDDDAREAEPQYQDTSRPVGWRPQEDPAAQASYQARIDAVVAAGNAAYGAVSPTTTAAALAPGADGHGPMTTTSDDTPPLSGEMRGGDENESGIGSGGRGGSGGGDTGEFLRGSSRRGGRGGHLGGGGRGGGSRGGGGGGGVKNPEWYLGYYDAGFNANPWARLEARLGLPAQGSWLEYDNGNGNGHGNGSGSGSGSGRGGRGGAGGPGGGIAAQDQPA